MRTSGKANDLWMMIIPGGVLAFFVLWMFGGPAQFAREMNIMLGEVVGGLSAVVSSLF